MKHRNYLIKFTSKLVISLVLPFALQSAFADRVKDLAAVAAQRSNQLIGFGLVVGLQGTGDDASVPFTTQKSGSSATKQGTPVL